MRARVAMPSATERRGPRRPRGRRGAAPCPRQWADPDRIC